MRASVLLKMADNMHFDTSPADLTPEERRTQVAALLARGVLRLRKRRLLAADPIQADAQQSSPNSLELSPKLRLNGSGRGSSPAK